MKRWMPFALGTVVASCLGPPAVAPTQSLAVGTLASAPRVAAPFAVVFSGPHGVVANLSEPGVTLLFNRAMRTLDEEDRAPPAVAVGTEAGTAVAGAWRWVGTHGLLFMPDADLPGATRFHVTVPRGVRSVDGEALAADFSFEFSTPVPRLVESTPAEGQATLRPESSIRLLFNQAVDPAALLASAKLLVRTGDETQARSVAFAAAVAPHTLPEAARDSHHVKRVVDLTPREPLPSDADVEVVLARGLRGEGPLTMEDPQHVHMRTFGPLRLAKVACPRVFDEALGKCQAHRDITVSMSNPVMPDEFRAHLGLGKLPRAAPAHATPPRPTAARPAPRRPRAPGAPVAPRSERPANDFALGADPDFDRRYHVVLKAGMTDVYGQRLAQDLAFDIDTEPPFSSAPATPPPHPTDGDATSTPPPQGSVRAIPPFEAAFGVDGYVVEASGAGHKIPVGLVNVPTFGLITRKLDVRETRQFLAGLATAPGGFLSGGYRFPWETIDPAANTRVVRNVDLDALLAPAGRGTALLALGTPGDPSPARQQLVSVTDLAVTAKMSRFGSLVWVTSLSTGKPVAGAQVSVGSRKKEDAKTFTTDDQGLAVIPPEALAPIAEHRASAPWERGSASLDEEGLLIVSHGDDWTYQPVEMSPSFARAAPPLDLGGSKEWQGTVFADRGIYRPGETVKLAAVLRQADARGLAIVGGRDAKLTLTDAGGEAIFETRAKLDALGGLAVDAPVPKSAHLGPVTATVSLPSSGATFATTLLLADFKPVEFTASVQADHPSRVRGDPVRFKVHGEYLFQAPMAGAATHDTAVRSVTSFTPPGTDGYVTSDDAFTGDYGDKSPRAGELLEQDATLDAAGDHEASMDLAMPGQTKPELVSFESDIEDFTRQVVAGAASVLVHPAEFYVGIGRPASRFVAVGANVGPRVLALRPDGTHVPAARVHVELVERTWTTVVEDQGDGSRRSHVVDTPVASCDVATSADAVSCPLRVPGAGYFIVRATASDARGNAVRASTALYALSDRPDEPAPRFGWSEGDARVVKLESDRATYEPGDTAKILVRNPFREAEALITVERAGVLRSQIATLRGPMPVVTVPIEDGDFPNVFVSAHLVRGRVQGAPTPAPGAVAGADVGGPDYRDGYVELGVSPQTHRLAVAVAADRKDHHPGDDVDVDVSVRDAQGRPAKAEVTFYAVDEGVLSLTDYKTPDPLAAFTRPRALSVFGLESRDHLARVLALRAGEKLKNLGWESSGKDKGDDGGGGGDEGRTRRDFRNTAYFEAGRVTGDDGRARFHFKLPDNLTTFRLMAVAATADRFGSGDAPVVTSKPLMVRPALPRAVRVGDRFDASVVVSGKIAGPVDVRLALAGTGLEATGPVAQRVMLPASGSVEAHFPVVARAPGDARITFSAVGSGGQGARDATESTRAVALPLHTETAAVYGETTQATGIALGDLSGVRADQGGLDVRLSSSALVGLEATFDQLDEYPYGCTEQLASRMLPLVALGDLARAVGARVPAATDARLQDGVAQMLAHQHDDGGFGYWDDDAPVPWLSAYAMMALDAASRAGVHVPADALDGGVDYLRKALAHEKFDARSGADGGADSNDDDGSADDRTVDDGLTSDDRAPRAYAEATFLADTLATLGKPDPGYLNRLYDARAPAPPFAQALLLHAMARAGMPRAQVLTLTAEVKARLRVDAGLAVAESDAGPLYAALLDTPARATALTLRALLAVDPAEPLAPRLARGLLDARGRQSVAWASTQENAWALLALDDYRRARESAAPDFDAEVFLGSSKVGTAAFHEASLRDERVTLPVSRVEALGGPLTLSVHGQGTLHYAASLEVATTALPQKPLDRGLFVQKTMRAVKLEDLAAATQWIPKQSATQARAGDLVVVDLILESAEPHEQVVVVDPLPAGLEAVDFDLATTGKAHAVDATTRTDVPPPKDALADLGMAFRTAAFHRELRDDRVLTFLPHLEPGLYHFRYLARATVVGRYVVPPTSAECMYSPDVQGRTAAGAFDVVR